MPTTYTEVYFPILVQVLLAMLIAGGMLGTSAILGRRVRSRVKDTPYESGIVPTGSTRERFSIKFYLVAMLFILFDIETVFLYPWAVVYRELKLFAFVEMLIFVVLILSGFFYMWKKGALAWSYEGHMPPATPGRGEEPQPAMGGAAAPDETISTAGRAAS